MEAIKLDTVINQVRFRLRAILPVLFITEKAFWKNKTVREGEMGVNLKKQRSNV